MRAQMVRPWRGDCKRPTGRDGVQTPGFLGLSVDVESCPGSRCSQQRRNIASAFWMLPVVGQTETEVLLFIPVEVKTGINENCLRQTWRNQCTNDCKG